MWKVAVFLLALLALANAETNWVNYHTYFNSTIHPMPHGGTFKSPEGPSKVPGVLSYLISTTDYTIDAGEEDNPDLKVSARVFLGNQTYAGPTEDWTRESTNGDWSKVKSFKVVDPCNGSQPPGSIAHLLIDPTNITLTSNIVFATTPLIFLSSGIAAKGDASTCLGVSRPLEGNPLQCPQYFKYDFSTVPDNEHGFIIGLTIASRNENPLPFSRAFLASGRSCPTMVRDEHWHTLKFSPNLPGVTPTRISFPGAVNGTHERVWWIMLDVPEEGVPSSTPFDITVTHTRKNAHHPSTPSSTSPPNGKPKPAPTPQRPSKPIPIWAVVIISLGCISLAVGALFWAWRLTKEKKPSNSYEFY